MRQVDLFAGLGGFSCAGEQAGFQVAVAANHWQLAVDAHALNHPNTKHYCQDLRQFDFAQLPQFDLLTAGPACQGHSEAGQASRKNNPGVAKAHKQLRSTAWAVIDCLEVCRPKYAIIENVPRFQKWKLFKRWRECMEDLGYAVSVQVLTASRWGVPQRRKRLMVIAHHEGPAIQVEDPDVPEPGVRGVFDPDAEGWIDIDDMRKTVSKKGYKTAREKAEISNARSSGALAWGQHTNYNAWGRSPDEPVLTITTVPGFFWWTRAGQYRLWTRGELAAAMTFPASYKFPARAKKGDESRLIGNAVPPLLARGVIREVLHRAA